jgi:hypothetical protein
LCNELLVFGLVQMGYCELFGSTQIGHKTPENLLKIIFNR